MVFPPQTVGPSEMGHPERAWDDFEVGHPADFKVERAAYN
jgi:hypothetical protein